MTTAMSETEVLSVFRRYMERISPTTSQFTEQLFNYAGQRRKLDLVLDDEQTLTVIAGKELLDDEALNQAFDMLAKCDASIIVCRQPQRITAKHKDILQSCKEKGIGVVFVDRGRVLLPPAVEPRRHRMSDPQDLRRQLRHREQELPAGKPAGGTNDTTEFFHDLHAALNTEGRIRMAWAGKYAKLPKGWTKTKAINEIKKHIETGQFNALVDGQYITTK